ncbi:MAG: hypothetical protein GWP91_23480, partial [Rhodobacterales bacterium]|nr:hypothetical protein [Rhodobacterales bacterium]
LALQGEEAIDWARRVGDRLLLPVVTKADEIVAVVDSLNQGQEAKVLLAGDGDPRSAWSKAWTQTDDLQAAVAHFLATGTGALAPGVRIDSDGVVHLGDPAAAVDALAIRDKITDLQLQIDEDSKALGGCRDRISSGRGSMERRFGAPHAQNARRAVQERSGQRRGLLKSEHDANQHQLQRQAEEAISEARALHRKYADQRVNKVRQRLSVVEEQAKIVLDQVRRTLARAARAVTEVRALAREKGDTRMLELRDVLNERRGAHVDAQNATSLRQRERDQAQGRVSDARLTVSKAQSNAALGKAAVEDVQKATLRACAIVTGVEQVQRKKSAEVKVLVEEMAVADAALAETERAVTVQRTSLAAAENEERQAAQEASAAGAMANARQERLRSATQQVAQARGRAAEAVQRRDRALAQAGELHADSRQAAADRVRAEVDLADVTDVRAKSWDRLQRERERATKLREGLKVAETTLRELQRAAETFTVDIAKQEEFAQKVRVDLEVLRRRMEERYQVSLSGLLDRVHAGSVVLNPDEAVAKSFEANGIVVEAVEAVALTWNMLDDADRVADVVESNAEHRKHLASLGEVNLGALEEYADLGTRFEELSSQRADLEASVADIRRAIAKMNKTCRQRFRDAFDRVNEHFNQVYPRLVGGGSARLALTDEEDLLQTGVEIFVQPPGKRLQILSLLSGGEKAMTAIALLISLFKVKPSPFCVLDEVDAPLDEANGARFNDIIKEMSSLTQFIVITHNRKTMEVADTLYGVTMAKPGVSRLVSVNL